MGRKQRDSGLILLTDEDLLKGARDSTLPASKRLRYQQELKFRGLRNVQKRRKS